jgi:hypothetical protein
MSQWYRDRPAPLSNKLVIGNPPCYEHEGNWYDNETHKKLEVTNFFDIMEELEKENELKRQAANPPATAQGE